MESKFEDNTVTISNILSLYIVKKDPPLDNDLMVLINAVADCEEYNRSYFVSLDGAVTADEPKELAQISLGLMRNPAKRHAMTNALETALHGSASQRIYAVMKEAVP